jgi:hypothetical protein
MPTDGAPREPLPRVEDLPVAEQGYEQESVKAAFDTFYRHAAQLDAALRTLEAVDSFHRHAAALRADLRALRAAGWTQQSWTGPPYGYGPAMRAPREGISPAVWRIAGEVAFLIAASVALGVAKLEWWVIVLVMAFAFLLVVGIEWLASRERFTLAAAPAGEHPVVEAAPAAPPEQTEESLGWTAFEEAQEPSDAMTIIGESIEAESEPGPEPEPELKPGPEPIAAVAEEEASEEEEIPEESEPVPETSDLHPRRRWFKRRAEAPETSADAEVDVPRHVRVLSADEQAAVSDPWEEGFDEAAAEEPDEDTGEELSAPAPRRFRRR